MKGLVGPVGCIAFCIVLFLSPSPAFTIKHKHIENFSTTLYKDAANTTAWWNTAAGELMLYPLPAMDGNYNTPGYAYSVAVSGDYAFVADNTAGLQIIDISDPANPVLAGTYNTPGIAFGIAVSGDLAFVADYTSGLQIIDISDPTNPTLEGSYDTPDYAVGIAVSGDHAFVTDLLSGLRVIDISDPAHPTLAGTLDTPGYARSVAISGDHAYVTDDSGGLRVVDISDPTSPMTIGIYNTWGLAISVAVSGDHAFVADFDAGLQVVDISNPVNPTLIGTYDTPGNAEGVAVSGDHAFVADHISGLHVIDISDPVNPTLTGTYNTPGYAYGVAVSGGHAFVADEAFGLQVINVSDPVNPALVGSCTASGAAWGVAVSGDHAFVADYYSGLQVIDVSDPANPTLAGNYNTPGSAVGVAIAGDLAFVADYDEGVQVIDISDPANPTLEGTCNTPGTAYGIAVSGDYAYVADRHAGLQVMDISDPAHPAIIASCTPAQINGVAVSGDYVYAASWNDGLQVIDISDPLHPVLAGSYDTPGVAWSVKVSGDHVFVADYNAGLQVIDISDPKNPTLAGAFDTPGNAFGVAVSGDLALVSDLSSGLHMIDISDPTYPTLSGSYDLPADAYDVDVSGEHAFVADDASGLQVIRVFQSEVDADRNIGRSLALDGSNAAIQKSRFVTTQTDIVAWELSADGGASWQGITPDGNWNLVTVPGNDLVWRSTHTWVAPGVNPSVTDLEIDWLYEAASVDSIVDIPDDQGGWVRAHFTRSGRDFADEATLPIANYALWRCVEGAALVAALQTQTPSAVEENAAADTPELGNLPVVKYQGRTYVQSRPGFEAASFPPGTWEWVATLPAVQQDTYIAAVPTVADSSASGTNYTVLLMTAHTTTPSIWYVSEPDTGYSLDNIAPAAPEGFDVAYNTGSGNHLAWDPCADEDFQYFNVYRSTDPDFDPSPSDLVHSLTGTSWNDPEYDGWNVYYKITAIDYVGNESDPASAGEVTAIAEPVIPKTYALYPNVPNPFNPTTSIRYDVPADGGVVTLRIYDVSGRLVRTLLDGPQPAGENTAIWNGRDNRGRNVASGAYFYRLQAPGYEKTMKMMVVR